MLLEQDALWFPQSVGHEFFDPGRVEEVIFLRRVTKDTDLFISSLIKKRIRKVTDRFKEKRQGKYLNHVVGKSFEVGELLFGQ